MAVLSTDPQASAGQHRVREAADPPVAAVPVSELERALKAADSDGFDLALIDSAPHVGPGAGIIARLSDLVLVPIQPGPFDIAALPETMELLRAAKRRAVILLSRCPGRSLDIDSARQAVDEMKFELAPVQIGDRTAYRRALASGKAVTELPRGAAEQASEEITELYGWLRKQNDKN